MSVLAIDAGTTGITVLLVDGDGRVRGRGYREFPQSFPRPGWVEHDPEDWWSATLGSAREALDAAGVGTDAVAAVGITNQRETTVIWERDTLRAPHPAIVWQDRRTAPLCDQLKEEGWEERIAERTGLVVDPYFSGTKVAWLLQNVDGLRDPADAGRLAFGTVDSYLIARLTGGRAHVTDHTNASRTMLFDIHRLAWDGEILDRLSIPPTLLPQTLPSAGAFGTTDPDAFLGLRVPVAGVAGDQQAALVGQACFSAGDAKNTYGTGSFVLLNTGTEPRAAEGLLTTIGYSDDEGVRYALEGSIFVTGAGIQWLRDGLGILSASSEAEAVASSVEDAGGVYFVPALVGLGAPWWDPYARGTILGITRGTTRAHLVRAVVESMAYRTRDVVDAMVSAGAPISTLKADGGASAMDLLLQFQADLIGVPVQRPVVQETTGLGAAFLAGLGTGVWSSKEEAASAWGLDREFVPGDRARADRLYEGWRRALERSRGWELP